MDKSVSYPFSFKDDSKAFEEDDYFCRFDATRLEGKDDECQYGNEWFCLAFFAIYILLTLIILVLMVYFCHLFILKKRKKKKLTLS